jgi:hypothetical protein
MKTLLFICHEDGFGQHVLISGGSGSEKEATA